MAKTKPATKVHVSDGHGGLVPLDDERFSEGLWPITFEIPDKEADEWVAYMEAECSLRGWGWGGLGQIEND